MGIEMIATIVTGLFAGGAGFISLVEHPARMGMSTEFAVHEFRPSFSRAHWIMASLAAMGFVLGFTAWVRGTGEVWLIGGLVMIANGPWTMTLIRPINQKLMDPTLDVASDQARTLIERWGQFHWVRTIFGCVGFLLFVYGMAQAS